jgi:hypothetical protein
MPAVSFVVIVKVIRAVQLKLWGYDIAACIALKLSRDYVRGTKVPKYQRYS